MEKSDKPDELGRFFAKLCSSFESSGAGFSLNLPDKTCITFFSQDSVIPAENMATLEATVIRSVSEGGHGQFELFEKCQKFLDSLD